MATIVEVLSKIDPSKISIQVVNQTVMEANKGSTKKKQPYIKVAVPDATCDNYLTFGNYKELGLLLHVDFDLWNKAIEECKSKDKI